jgi:hypothetical protein
MTMQHSTMPTARSSPASRSSPAAPSSPAASSRQDQTEATVSELVRRAYDQTTTLIRHEIDFARSEMTGKAKAAAAGAGMLGAGAFVAFFGAASFVAAAILGLARVVPGWASALIIGAALFLVAGLSSLIGRARLRSATPVPRESVRRVRADLDTVTSAARHPSTTHRSQP